MKRYALTLRAKSDLQGIWDYTDEKWGREQARAYSREIEAAIQRVVSNPNLGKSCEEIRHGYRRYATGSHVLFYKAASGQITFVRILHGRMDFARHF
jgi:toxin ParE1/3/4